MLENVSDNTRDIPVQEPSARGRPVDPVDPGSLAVAHEHLAQLLLGERPLAASLSLIAQQLPEMDEASITLIMDGKPRSLAVLGEHAAWLDERQYLNGDGPGLRAAVSGITVGVDDTSSDTTYPAYSRDAAQAGFDHSLSIALPLSVPGRSAALNLYGRGVALDPVSRSVAASFAGYLTVALTNAALLAEAQTEVGHMRKAMASRAVIEQAKGIIMSKRGCTADEAFGRLRTVSNEANFKLRDVAQDLVNSTAGHAPGGR